MHSTTSKLQTYLMRWRKKQVIKKKVINSLQNNKSKDEIAMIVVAVPAEPLRLTANIFISKIPTCTIEEVNEVK